MEEIISERSFGHIHRRLDVTRVAIWRDIMGGVPGTYHILGCTKVGYSAMTASSSTGLH
jgi:hypothetical protein